MPKMKTNKSTAKRFRKTKGGKVRFKQKGLRHLLTNRKKKSKRSKRKAGYLATSDKKKVLKVMPYL